MDPCFKRGRRCADDVTQFASPIPSSSSLMVVASNVLILVVGITLLYFLSPLWLRFWVKGPDGTVLPPGPALRYSFLRKYPERTLHAWAKSYGPLFSIWMGTQLFIVISDPHIARDLLVVNGSNFSTRKKYFMKNQMILRGRAITASEYGDRWRQHRRIATQLLTPKAIQGYADVMDYEAHIFIRSLFDETKQGLLPINPSHYCGRFALNNMLIISFATRTDSTSDPLVEKALELAMEFMDLTGPWSNAIDFFEPLQLIPSKMRSRGRKLHQGLVDVYGTMINRVQDRMDNGEDVPDCLVKTLLQTREGENLDWEDLCMLSAVFTLGGVHSTSGLIQWFLALISSHPEVQARAHQELDRVVGRDRWPTAEDEASLPYIRAVIKEVQRVHAPFWMATPHCSSEDFVYKGMFIPKETVVVLNCFTLHHNEERYPDPYTFNPDRFLGDHLSCGESAKLANVMERDHWTFGAGRRICPGLPAAERELWLAISRLLWAFSFQSILDEPISLEEYEGLSGRTPLPFRLKLNPRIEKLQEFLQSREEITMKF
ncbi:Cytochrome P450 2F2 [Termitomyces sp. T112]|nr:Cytochrome P450 2F2 [Termitomyces sp. T112]